MRDEVRDDADLLQGPGGQQNPEDFLPEGLVFSDGRQSPEPQPERDHP